MLKLYLEQSTPVVFICEHNLCKTFEKICGGSANQRLRLFHYQKYWPEVSINAINKNQNLLLFNWRVISVNRTLKASVLKMWNNPVNTAHSNAILIYFSQDKSYLLEKQVQTKMLFRIAFFNCY